MSGLATHDLSCFICTIGGAYEADKITTEDLRKWDLEKLTYGWTEKRLTQEEAARLLGVCDRTFRHYINRYEENRNLKYTIKV